MKTNSLLTMAALAAAVTLTPSQSVKLNQFFPGIPTIHLLPFK
jgi:hypothetical protein